MFANEFNPPHYDADADPQGGTRELVLVVLEQLYVCYDKLDSLGDAAPLLDRLTEIACNRGGKAHIN